MVHNALNTTNMHREKLIRESHNFQMDILSAKSEAQRQQTMLLNATAQKLDEQGRTFHNTSLTVNRMFKQALDQSRNHSLNFGESLIQGRSRVHENFLSEIVDMSVLADLGVKEDMECDETTLVGALVRLAILQHALGQSISAQYHHYSEQLERSLLVCQTRLISMTAIICSLMSVH